MSHLNKYMKPSVKVLLIFNELKKYNAERFAEKDILNASAYVLFFLYYYDNYE